MAWTYEQSFDSLSVGDLNGQDSWSGSTIFDVTAATAYNGTKSVVATNSDGLNIARTLPAEIQDGSAYWAMRRSSTGNSDFDCHFREDATVRMAVRWHRDGNILLFNSGVYDTTLVAWSTDTWIPLNLEFNNSTQPNQYRVRAYTGGAWGSFSSWIATNGSYGSIHSIRFDFNGSGGGDSYFDAISPSDITGGAAVSAIVMNLQIG